MERGLLWLPLLFLFIGLAWAGWNEYQKVEAYRLWAQSFQRAKYDIYAVLGQLGEDLTWGKPTRRGPVQLQTFSLQQVESIELLVDGQAIPPDTPLPDQGKRISLKFSQKQTEAIEIPFTEVKLAAQWRDALLRDQQNRPSSV